MVVLPTSVQESRTFSQQRLQTRCETAVEDSIRCTLRCKEYLVHCRGVGVLDRRRLNQAQEEGHMVPSHILGVGDLKDLDQDRRVLEGLEEEVGRQVVHEGKGLQEPFGIELLEAVGIPVAADPLHGVRRTVG